MRFNKLHCILRVGVYRGRECTRVVPGYFIDIVLQMPGTAARPGSRGGAQGMGGQCCVHRDCTLITSLMKTSEYDPPVQLSARRSRWLIVQ